jgi:hypothetical protein
MATEPVGVCRWCSRDITWDHHAGGWRHVESHSLLCPNGSRAAIDTTSRTGPTNMDRRIDIR